MLTQEIEASKIELIREILNINSKSVLEHLRLLIRTMVHNEADDPTRMSNADFFAMIDNAKASIERGEGIKINNKQELSSFLQSL